jgi:hypothetical protein
MSEQLEALLEQARCALKTAQTAAGTTPEAVEALRQEAERADDYRQIMNAMSKHVFGYYGQIQEKELDAYWSKRDDIVYAHGSMAYYGRQDVYNYYTGMTAALKQQGRETAEKFYGQTYGPEEGPGYKVMNMLLSPYVEIAADRQTARGVWMAYAYMTHLKAETGKPETSLGLSRYSCEFIREDGQWKIWHRVDHVECGLAYQDMGPMMMPPKGEKDGKGGPPKGGPGPGMPTIAYVGQKTLAQRSGSNSPCEPSYPEPAIPEPYETWTEETSYIVVECDGYNAQNFRPN